MARRNAEVVLLYSTVYPFRVHGKFLMCVYCCEKFTNPDHFRKHVDEDHEKFTISTAFAHIGRGKDSLKVDCYDLRCRVCSQPLSNLKEAAKHIKNLHPSTQTKRMNIQYDIAMQPYVLIKDKLHCYLCDKKFPTLTKLCRHTTSHYQKYTCDTCGRSYMTHEALKYHIRCCHSGTWVCRKCWKDFPDADARRDHIRNSKSCWTFACIYCGDRFQSWENKQKHLVAVHSCPETNYPCPDCDMTFRKRKFFYDHYKIAHTDEGLICSCCGLKFSSRKYLDDHRLGHSGEKLFRCTVCSKSFSRNKSLVQHMWIHSETKRFVCMICEKQFAQKVSLKRHMKVHHPEVDLEF